MEALVHVTLKKTVLDPQGRTICSALNSLGHSSVASVRQGKYFEIELADGADPAQARESVERIAREVLANPVIEEYTVEIKE
ncbi:MAG: phosphoribosylformylglycinamidine synthase subunit PurS [Bryobacterales bacterium]|nr:phosphoribosylformylglycinamidine synthase subunit PurS [Acidobacteriota bacterium]MCB9382988.1 phosphoribosylformylglycinamidine synthase subunit PurS [Bryobacterales bacterium]